MQKRQAIQNGKRSKTGVREGLYFSPFAHLVALNLTDWITHGDFVPWFHKPTHTKRRDTRLNRSQRLVYPRKSHHSLISTVWIPSPVSGRLKGITLPCKARERLFIVHHDHTTSLMGEYQVPLLGALFLYPWISDAQTQVGCGYEQILNYMTFSTHQLQCGVSLRPAVSCTVSASSGHACQPTGRERKMSTNRSQTTTISMCEL